ncbi:MAG: TonB-dependent receptor plug domain-containing protein, partial [Methylococcus sp.]
MKRQHNPLMTGSAALLIGLLPTAQAETVRDAATPTPRESQMAKPDNEAVDADASSERISARKKVDKPIDGDTVELDEVHVVSDSPLTSPETGVSIYKTPSPVQTVTSDEMEETQTWNLPDYMRRYMGSVTVNDAQNNPMQQDVQFRGFSASPLLGVAQGLSV